MLTRRIISIVLCCAAFILITLLTVFIVLRNRGQCRIYEHCFEKVEQCLSRGFGRDLCEIGFLGFSDATNLLAEGISYALEVHAYQPGNHLRLEARMGQVGNETTEFRVQSLGDTRTEVCVNQFATLFVFFSFCRDREQEILDAVAEDLDSGRKREVGIGETSRH